MDDYISLNICDICHKIIKTSYCEIHSIHHCKICCCVECLSIEEQISYYKSKIDALILEIFLYKNLIKGLEKNK